MGGSHSVPLGFQDRRVNKAQTQEAGRAAWRVIRTEDEGNVTKPEMWGLGVGSRWGNGVVVSGTVTAASWGSYQAWCIPSGLK